jgi:hypothetical protein
LIDVQDVPNMAVYISEREDRQTKIYGKSKIRSERKKREREIKIG